MMLDEIRKMSHEELKSLAEEIRQRIVEVVLKNGGTLLPIWGRWNSHSLCTASSIPEKTL